MHQIPHTRMLFLLTTALCLLIIITSVGGVLYEKRLYGLETPYYLPQLIGTDMVLLLLVTPTLLTSATFMLKNSRKAYFVWSGAVIFTIYIFLSYTLTIHFNSLFLVYCAALGLSFHLLLIPLMTLDAERVKSWFPQNTKTISVVICLIAIAALQYALELSDAVSALVAGRLPTSAAATGFITSPFHVFDLSLFFPGLIISAVLLYNKRALGYLLAPSFLGFLSIMTFALAVMVILIALRGFPLEVEDLVIFSVLAAISGSIFVYFLRYCSRG